MIKGRIRKNVFQFWMLIFLMALFSLPLFLSAYISSPKEKAVFQSKAFSCGVGLPVAAAEGVEGLQNKINAAKNGDVVNVSAGTYSGSTAVPLGLGDSIGVSDSRGGSETCMIRIENKTLTLKGAGPATSIIYGEGHAKPYTDPYQHRAGICIINSNVTIDNLRVKEFQKRCMVVYNSSVVVKNSVIEGCDEGGASLLGNSAGLFVNNFFQFFNFGGIMLWQNSQAKVVNNILNGANIMFFFHPNTDDKANAEIINNIFSSGSKINQVDWWKSEAAKLQNVKASNNLFDADSSKCTPPLEYCNDFPGKISGDPLFTEPVGDMCGVAPWANYSLKDGSPATGVGDAQVPGPKILGNAGGPCSDPSSSICSSYIQANMPKAIISPEVKPSQQPIVDDQEQIDQNNPPIVQPPVEEDNSRPNPTPPNRRTTPPNRRTSPIYNNVFSQAVLFIGNISRDKTIRIRSLFLQDTNQDVEAELPSGKSVKYSFSSLCNGLTLSLNGGLAYASSLDNYQSIRYKTLNLDCYKAHIIDIE